MGPTRLLTLIAVIYAVTLATVISGATLPPSDVTTTEIPGDFNITDDNITDPLNGTDVDNTTLTTVLAGEEVATTTGLPEASTTENPEATTPDPDATTPDPDATPLPVEEETTASPEDESGGGGHATAVGVVMGMIIVVLVMVVAVLALRLRKASDYSRIS